MRALRIARARAAAARWALAVITPLIIVVACGGDDTVPTPDPHPAPSPSSSANTVGGGFVARDGDTVSVHYTGTLDDGEVFDSSTGRAPLTFTVGSGQVIAGFDRAVRGLSVGERTTARMEPDEAYGPIREEMVLDVPRADAPADLQVGDRAQLASGATMVVVAITDEIVRIDANHPLAGQALTFEIEVVAIDRDG